MKKKLEDGSGQVVGGSWVVVRRAGCPPLRIIRQIGHSTPQLRVLYVDNRQNGRTAWAGTHGVGNLFDAGVPPACCTWTCSGRGKLEIVASVTKEPSSK